MKVCTETHQVASFGEIPEGSLWDDDSPYIEDASKFADVPQPMCADCAPEDDGGFTCDPARDACVYKDIGEREGIEAKVGETVTLSDVGKPKTKPRTVKKES